MNLHGEHLVCVKKFEEQGKAAETRSKLPHQLFSKLFHQSTDSLAPKRSIRNQALMVRTVAEHPRFADRLITGKRRGEQTGQAMPAPQTVLIDRVEPQRIQRRFIHAVSSNSRVRRPAFGCIRSALLHRREVFAAARSLIAERAVIQSLLGCRDVGLLASPNL